MSHHYQPPSIPSFFQLPPLIHQTFHSLLSGNPWGYVCSHPDDHHTYTTNLTQTFLTRDYSPSLITKQIYHALHSHAIKPLQSTHDPKSSSVIITYYPHLPKHNTHLKRWFLHPFHRFHPLQFPENLPPSRSAKYSCIEF